MLRAALEKHILPKHMDALLRILTLSTEVVSPRHLPPAAAAAVDTSARDGGGNGSSFTRSATTYSCLASECMGVLALWFNGATQQHRPASGGGPTPSCFADALLSALAKPDKSCARFVSSISACATIEEKLKKQAGEGTTTMTTASLFLLQRARQVSVGVLLLLYAALDAPGAVVRRWKPGLEANNFFSLCQSAIALATPIVLSGNNANAPPSFVEGQPVHAVRQLLDGVVERLHRLRGLDDGEQQQGGRKAMPLDDEII